MVSVMIFNWFKKKKEENQSFSAMEAYEMYVSSKSKLIKEGKINLISILDRKLKEGFSKGNKDVPIYLTSMFSALESVPYNERSDVIKEVVEYYKNQGFSCTQRSGIDVYYLFEIDEQKVNQLKFANKVKNIIED